MLRHIFLIKGGEAVPGAITHLKAAYIFDRKHGFSKPPEFYLGSIAPDCVNLHGHAEKSLRWTAHLRDSSLDVWENNTECFFNEFKGRVNEGLLEGYVLHILTDIVWDREFDLPLYMLLLKSGVEEESLKDERWKELFAYEKTQFSEPWFKDAVFKKLAEAKAFDIGALKTEDMLLWRDKTLRELPQSESLPKFLDEAFMTPVFESVSQVAERIFRGKP